MAIFDGTKQRFWGYVGDQLTTYSRPFNNGGGFILNGNREAIDRWTEYAVRWAYFENKSLYHTLKQHGARKVAMDTSWNPVPATVAFYVTNTLGGKLDIETPEENANGDALKAAIKQVWEWSDFDVMKGALTEAAGVLGDVFIKVAERRPDGDEGETAGVYLQDIPPESVRYWEADPRGYLTAIRIDTPLNESIFTGNKRRHILVELWRKEFTDEDGNAEPGGVRYYEIPVGRSMEDKELKEPVRASTFDELGYDFIPVVWARAQTYWWQLADQIDRHNALAHKMDKLNRPTGVVHGRHTDPEGRPMPAPRINVTDVETTYQETADGTFGWIKVPGLAQFDWASSPIDFATMGRQMDMVRQGVEAALPEYRVATLDASQVATETLAMLLNQAGQRVLELRGILERALERAQAMAVTIGQLAELDGFAEAGDWDAGTLEHSFVERAVFETPDAVKATTARDLTAAGIPARLALKLAGYDDGILEEYDTEAAAEQLRQRTTLAAALVQARANVDSGAADNGALRI